MRISRPGFLRALATAAVAAPATALAVEGAGWKPGCLEVHHISTGRGNATLLIGPDGTSILVDAGSVRGTSTYLAAARPDGSRRPGEWIARYVARALAPTGRIELDYFILTHFHPDHLGDPAADSPRSRFGDYRLTGVTDVAEAVPIRRFIDRGAPNYDYPSPLENPMVQNYRRFVAVWQRRGSRVERFRPGSATQIALVRRPNAYPSFGVRNLVANGEVWTGTGTATRRVFPELSALAPADYPDENMCSLAMRVEYGGFSYFTGGDLTDGTAYGAQPWRDVESAVAAVSGPVDAASVDHHGYYDAAGPAFVRELRPRAFVIPAWHVTHPALSTLERLLSRRLYPGERDVYALATTAASASVNERLMPQLKSDAGHVVVRVPPGGREFRVRIVDDADESDRVKATFGPYATRGAWRSPG